MDYRNNPYPWQKAAIRSLNTTPQNSYKITPSYEIPTCQQLHIGYSFTFCSSWHQLLFVREIQITRYGLCPQSSYYKTDLKPCNLENAVFTGIKPREEIWEMFNIFSQTLSEAMAFWCHHCYQHNLLQNSFTRAVIITLTHLQGLRCPAAKYMTLAEQKREHSKECKTCQLCLHLFPRKTAFSSHALFISHFTLCNHWYESCLKFSGF